MLTSEQILSWLRCDDPAALEELWQLADTVRHCCVGDAVHLRGLVEISNTCVRQCAYCGLRAGHTELQRYRMSAGEILDCAAMATRLGYGTVVLQAGEDPLLAPEDIAAIVRGIKSTTPLAVTLSLGEQEDENLTLWKSAGADRYLLRFETSDTELYRTIHPPYRGRSGDRFPRLRKLRELGYEVGSGVMAGIPGQTYQSLARDIELFAELDLDMIGIGPFISHPATPLGDAAMVASLHARAGADQAPATELLVYKMVALTRIMCPQANLPSTTALATINKTNGRELGLQRGANVVMPNLTPVKYRAMYEIYPAKACIDESAEDCSGCLRSRIARIGRKVGQGQGGRKKQACPKN